MDSFSIRIIIADDHPAIIAGVSLNLAQLGTLQVMGHAHSSTELIELLDKTPCDVLISDYAMPNGKYGDGIALFSLIARRYPATKLVVLTMLDNPIVLNTLLNQKNLCIVSKSDAMTHLIPAIHAAYSEGKYYSPKISEAMATLRGNRQDKLNLSQRESEVVRLYASGMAINEIAEQLSRSKKTISTQKTRAMQKLGIEKDMDLLRYAFENGLITLIQLPASPDVNLSEGESIAPV